MRTRIQRPKTKAQIIETMQRREAIAWQDLEMCTNLFGKHDDVTRRSRARWYELFEAMEEAGIPTSRAWVTR